MNSLEGGREFSKHIFILAYRIDDCIILAAHDAIPDHNIIFDLNW